MIVKFPNDSNNVIESYKKISEIKKIPLHEVEKIIEQGKAQLGAEREAVMRGIRSEAAELVSSAVEKILSDVSGEKIDKALASKALSGLKSKSSNL